MKHKCKRVSWVALVSLISILLVDCATKYAARGGWPDMYGYSEAPIDGSTYQVTFSGNSATDAATVERYALFRAAELTTSKGYDYFVVLSSADDVTKTTSGIVTNTQITATGTNEHTTTKTIRMFKGQRPSDNAQAYDAKSMIEVMGPQITR